MTVLRLNYGYPVDEDCSSLHSVNKNSIQHTDTKKV